jgi:hypothetical protein
LHDFIYFFLLKYFMVKSLKAEEFQQQAGQKEQLLRELLLL